MLYSRLTQIHSLRRSRNPWTTPIVEPQTHTLSRNWKRRITMLERSPSRPPQRSLIHVGFFTLFAAAIFAIPMLNIVPIRTLMARDDKPQSQPTPESKPETVPDKSSVEITPSENRPTEPKPISEDPPTQNSEEKVPDSRIPTRTPSRRAPIDDEESNPPRRGLPGLPRIHVEEEEIISHTPPAKPQPEFLPEPTDKEQDIFRILSLPLDFPFDVQQESLQGVVDLLKIRLNIQILIDKKNLEEAGIALDTPQFDLQVTDIKIESLLKLLFEPHDLAYSVEDGVLKISTRSTLNTKKRVYIYPVGDLVSTRDDLGELLSTIESTLRTLQQNNEFQGGTFSINSSTRTLVATHSYNSHQEVLNLLRALRQAAALSPNTFLPASRTPASSRGRNGVEDANVRFAPRTIPATGGFGGGFGRGPRRDEVDAPPVRATDDDVFPQAGQKPTQNKAPTYEEGVVPPRKQEARPFLENGSGGVPDPDEVNFQPPTAEEAVPRTFEDPSNDDPRPKKGFSTLVKDPESITPKTSNP